ncbi:hypothetical protein NC653_000032 [Populus alba x Populus x berolinensis]|uniref:Uncharacterized protein n=1 Tax=Populus alba x Populus x berolinensis TaxID=444605 RepID=A0AAD6RIP6_9ROSI|nr:hypothetical protein NC653_000032 [Populus alba x Populus x berolinensis]
MHLERSLGSQLSQFTRSGLDWIMILPAMHSISDESGGTFSFIESIDILQDAFARLHWRSYKYCGSGRSTQSLGQHHQECRFCRPLLGDTRIKIFDQGHQATIDIGDLYAEEEKDFLVFLSIPVFPAVDGEERLENMPLVDVSGFQKDSLSTDYSPSRRMRELRYDDLSFLSPIDRVPCLEIDRQRNRLLVTRNYCQDTKDG